MKLAAIVLISLVTSIASAKNPCERLLTAVDANLYTAQSIAPKYDSFFNLGFSDSNNNFIKAIEEIPYDSHLSMEQAYQLLDELNELPQLCKDDKPMGVCFARAYYAHMRLLQMDIPKNHIYKVWAIGPHSTGEGKDWAYHVAILVPIKGFGWRLIDASVPDRVYSLSLWYSRFKSKSKDNRLKLFLTEAAKLGPVTAKYDRMQMGLDLAKDKDIYRGYFRLLNKLISKYNKDTSRPDSTL